MLTSIYYYNSYRPYLVKSESNPFGKKILDRNEKLANEFFSDEYTIQLNKALKPDIVNYAKDIYTNVIDLKYNANEVLDDLDSYLNQRGADFDFRVFSENITEDLAAFADNYNNSAAFSTTQSHSNILTNFSSGLRYVASSSTNELNKIGLSQDEQGMFVFDPQKIKSLVDGNESEMYTALNETTPFFREIGRGTQSVLASPMSSHMNFKGLTYYYNYKFDKIQMDSFQLIRSGLLLDVAL